VLSAGKENQISQQEVGSSRLASSLPRELRGTATMFTIEVTKEEGQMLVNLLEKRKFTIDQPGDRKLCEGVHKKLLDVLSGPGLDFDGGDNDQDED